MSQPRTSFDAQAADFDRRVGLPEEDCRAIAAAVLRLAAVGPADRLLEVGAGTGLLGRWLAPDSRYLGLDLSRPMLEVFRRRAAASEIWAPLVQADGGRPWPVAAGSLKAVFSSRAIHLLPVAHVADELERVLHRPGVCLLGWVERRPESLKARMARRMQQRLRERGYEPRRAGSRRLLEECRRRGGADLGKTVVVSWAARHTARQSLDDWRSKEGLGGLVLPPGVQEEILQELETWAMETFGGLDHGIDSEDAYVLEGVRFA